MSRHPSHATARPPARDRMRLACHALYRLPMSSLGAPATHRTYFTTKVLAELVHVLYAELPAKYVLTVQAPAGSFTLHA